MVGLCKEGRKTFKGGFGCIFKSAYRDTQHIEIVEGGKKIWEMITFKDMGRTVQRDEQGHLTLRGVF